MPSPGANNIPTGPRLTPTSSTPSTPILQAKPFNPPKGPAAGVASNNNKRPPMSFAEQVLADIPPIIPGGKIDPAQTILSSGVLPELQAHTDQLLEEEAKIRADRDIRRDKLRRDMAEWEAGQRELEIMRLKTDLAEQSLNRVLGDGVGGAAF